MRPVFHDMIDITDLCKLHILLLIENESIPRRLNLMTFRRLVLYQSTPGVANPLAITAVMAFCVLVGVQCFRTAKHFHANEACIQIWNVPCTSHAVPTDDCFFIAMLTLAETAKIRIRCRCSIRIHENAAFASHGPQPRHHYSDMVMIEFAIVRK